MIRTHVATSQQWAVVSIPGNPALLPLEGGQHLSTVHPFTIHDTHEEAVTAMRVLDPAYEPAEDDPL